MFDWGACFWELTNIKMEPRSKRCTKWFTVVARCQNEEVVRCACQDNIKLKSLGWYAHRSKLYCPSCTRTWYQQRDIHLMISQSHEHMCGMCREELGRASGWGGASGGASSSGSQLSPINQSAALLAISGQLDELTQV